jgi:hypothetical protein
VYAKFAISLKVVTFLLMKEHKFNGKLPQDAYIILTGRGLQRAVFEW